MARRAARVHGLTIEAIQGAYESITMTCLIECDLSDPAPCADQRFLAVVIDFLRHPGFKLLSLESVALTSRRLQFDGFLGPA
jgi:hypothetical protein